MDNLSLADISAVTRGADGFLEGNGIIILILFFLIFGFGGNGGWNRGFEGAATPAQVYDATNQQSINNSLAGIKEAINAGTYENARLIDQVNYNGMQNTNAITNAMNAGFNSVNGNINNLSHQLEQCCCNLRSQMLQDKYDDVRNQLNLAEIASANAVQTQNILGQIGRYVTNPPCYGQYGYNYGTTIA